MKFFMDGSRGRKKRLPEGSLAMAVQKEERADAR